MILSFALGVYKKSKSNKSLAGTISQTAHLSPYEESQEKKSEDKFPLFYFTPQTVKACGDFLYHVSSFFTM
jgi:hypothetical protein